MRNCLVISLLLVAAMCVGCRTQTWNDTQFEPGSGRNADMPWQVHSGLVEMRLAYQASSGGVNNETSEEWGGYTLDIDQMNAGISFFAGYMINDYWELGGFVEYAKEVWATDVRRSPGTDPDMFGDWDVHGVTFGPRLIYNFSQTGTDVVPYIAASAGFGGLTIEPDESDDSLDATRMYGQIGLGLRFFVCDGWALSLEGFYRNTSTSVDGEIEDVTTHSDEGGLLFGCSFFF